MSTEADTLSRAAALMRERAEAAVCNCGGPVCNVKQGWFGKGELKVRLEGSESAVPHVHAWSPVVALAVSDWLDHEAENAADRSYSHSHDGNLVYPCRPNAFAVATAYLKEAL